MRRRLMRWGLPVVLLAVFGAGAAMAAQAHSHAGAATVRAVKSSTLGMILVGPNGHTLYRYTLDRKKVNRCTSNATCNKYWPPLLVKLGAKPTVGSGAKVGLLGTITAAHGMRQVTYAGFPLYFFAGDKQPGQTAGQGFQSQWYVVSTAGAFVKHAVATPTPAPAPTTTSSSAWG